MSGLVKYIITQKIAELASHEGFHEVYITGGEPLLSKIFLDVYKVFRLKGFITSVYTNGTYLPKSISDEFSKLMPHRVEITLYGMSNKTYKEVTGKKIFDNVISNILSLKTIGCSVFLKYNLMKSTKDDFDDFVRFCNTNDIKYTVNSQIIPKLNGDTFPLLQRLERTEIKEIGEKYQIDFFPKLNTNKLDSHNCDIGESLYFDSQLKVRGCPVLTSFDFDMIDDNSLDYIQKFFKKYKENKEGNYCPAWLNLEKESDIKKFVDGVE